MEGVAHHLVENKIDGKLIKVGGYEEDLIFSKDIINFRKDAKACVNDLNNSSICIGGTAWLFCNNLLTEEARS